MILPKVDIDVHRAMVQLQMDGTFNKWFKAIIVDSIEYLREQNDTEKNVIEIRRRQGAIKALKEIKKALDAARDTVKQSGRNF